MDDILLDEHLQIEDLGLSIHKCQIDDSEGLLHLCELEQVLQHDGFDGILVDVDHDTHTVPVGLVAKVSDTFELLGLHQLCDLCHQFGLVHLVGDLVHDDRNLSSGPVLIVRVGTDPDLATSGAVSGDDSRQSVDGTSGGEVGTFDVFHQIHHGSIRAIDGVHDRIHDLAEVVRRHVGGHSHGDTCGTVKEQIGELGRKHGRLPEGLVEVPDHVHGVLVYIGQEIAGHLGETRLGVPHGGCGIPVNGTEVTLSVDQRISEGERLSQPHHRIVRCDVSVGVILT